MQNLLNTLGINETYTKQVKKPTKFNHIRDNIPLKKNFNFMADLIELPVTKKKFKYLLVCVDLATDEFDVEPMKDKEAKTVLKSLLTMFKRNFIKKPKYSFATDSGSEFKGVFHKWLYDESIYHKVALPNRHTQQATVESLNKQIVRVLNGYMNKIEESTQMPYNEWTDIIDVMRKDMNKFRKKPEFNPITTKMTIHDTKFEPLFNVGDVVYRQSDVPLNALGNPQPTNTFRVGDYRYVKVPKKIVKIIYMSGTPAYRYMLDGVPRASFTEAQLLKVDEDETKHEVRKIIDKKIINKRVHYLVWWKNDSKKNATFESRTNLVKDGFTKEIRAFEEMKL
jgi:hypothetical protein